MPRIGDVEYGFVVETKGDTPPLMKQVHGNILHFIRSRADRKALLDAPADGDGVVALHATEPVYVFTADCVPVLLFSSDPGGPIAAVHCGWKGAAAGIAEKALREMRVPPEEVHLILGPSIRGDRYRVREDFLEAFRQAGRPVDAHVVRKNGEIFFDLPDYLLATQLSHIPVSNRHLGDLRCTHADPTLPSYRRDGDKTRRIRSWIVRH